ncbi:DUF4232 domain-containing protein [Streptomyces sp. MUM 2J]|uniref:DUF4232 domain-containing protein n=1 Tax=Streptomyces sp. MUM 2J TaxID=2791987 RepID=UPI001F04D918|nr:DUF4232 domain-containing protein [Streptomyces sp. MUM 2J]
MSHSKRSMRSMTAFASACAVPALLCGCGGGGAGSGTAGPPAKTASGTTAGTPATAGAASSPLPAPGSPGTRQPPTGTTTRNAGSGSRCHTSELSASVGRNDPGAGQENFPVVLTNASSRTCTVYGFPGAAFVDAGGHQLGPDPLRETGSVPRTVTLAPGGSAWAGLRYSNPQISGARTATPAALLVTPPDERKPLKVPWTAGEVPVGGNTSSVFLATFRPGTGP